MSFGDIFRNVLEGVANLIKGAYSFSQNSFGDFIITAVLLIIVIMVFKKLADSGTRGAQAVARAAEATSNTATSFSDVCMMVAVVVLVIVGIYKADNITGVQGSVGKTDFRIGVEAPENYDLENYKNPVKIPNHKESENFEKLEGDIQTLQRQIALQDSINARYKEDLAAINQPVIYKKTEKSSFWNDLKELDNTLIDWLGLDGYFRKTKKSGNKN